MEDKKQAALEMLRAKRAANAAKRSPPPPAPLASTQPHILAPASSPISSPGLPSKHFSYKNNPTASSSSSTGGAVRPQIFGLGEMMDVDEPIHRPSTSSLLPPTSGNPYRSHSPNSAPESPRSSHNYSQTDKPVKKKLALSSRDVSDTESNLTSPVSSPKPDGSSVRWGSAVPSRLQTGMGKVKLGSNSSAGTSVSGDADMEGGDGRNSGRKDSFDDEDLSFGVDESPLGVPLRKFKHRAEIPSSPASTPTTPNFKAYPTLTSLSAHPAPSTPSHTTAPDLKHIMTPSSALQPERIKRIFPELNMVEIEETMRKCAHEPARVIMEVFRKMQEGIASRSTGGERPSHRAAGTMPTSSSSSPIPSGSSPAEKEKPKVIKPIKQSAIYANRPGTASTSTHTRAPSFTRAAHPADQRPVFKPGEKRKRVGGSSGSEAEYGGEYDSDDSVVGGEHDEMQDLDEEEALRQFNSCEPVVLTGSIVCSEEQAAIIVRLRPYTSVEDLKKRLTKTRGVSYSLFEQYINVMQGYIEVDRCLSRCEKIGKEIETVMGVWASVADKKPAANGTGSASGAATPSTDTGLHTGAIDMEKLVQQVQEEQDEERKGILMRYVKKQPELLAEGIELKDYQMLGLNWLNLLHEKKLSCILADDMGLGKTIQVIAFFALLKEQGNSGPHLIVVPSSTLENWVREFNKFAPSINVQTYYGSQKDRQELQYDFKAMADEGTLEVLLTTYDLAWKPDDNKFLRKRMRFECAVFDEGHVLKNFQSQRYEGLIQIRPRWRLLLTGTPLQNNLQELVSLLNFIHEGIFKEAEDHLRQIFKVHAKGGTVNLLSQQRVSRARTMMTPFVLRRRKAQVLTLPPRTETVKTCRMTDLQTRLYQKSLRQTKAVIDELVEDSEDTPVAKGKGKSKDVIKVRDDSSTNVLMDLRKAASHPLLFRSHYDAAKIRKIAKLCMKEPEFKESTLSLIIEDMEVMSDAELHFFCVRYPKSCGKEALPMKEFMDVGKMEALVEILDECKKKNKRLLLFSQLTQILDILQVALEHLGLQYLRLDGGTKVDERQNMVDEFTDNEEIKVFLLSTRAGGMGINLVAASVVCIYDQDFNPHNDRQAADRAYRIGQTREVEVIRLISDGSIDEDMYRIGVTKLQLDDAVGGAAAADGEAGSDQKTVNEMKKSLLSNIRMKMDGVDIPAANGGVAAVDAKKEEEVIEVS